MLRAHGALSRADLGRLTGLSRSTISTVVGELIGEGIVREADPRRPSAPGGGRPTTPVHLDGGLGGAISIVITESRLAVGAFDVSHNQLAVRDKDLQPESIDQIAGTVAEVVDDVLSAGGLPRERVIGAAMSVPAPIDDTTRNVGQGVIPAIVGGTLEAAVTGALGIPTRLENDANLKALAEHTWGVAKGHDDAIYMELSRGVGAGLIIDGQLHRGARGTAGEIGHVRVERDGILCRCGNRGCLETVAGTDAIVAMVADLFPTSPTIDQVLDLALAGDPRCHRAFRDTGRRIGSVLGGVCNVLNPTVAVIGGDLARAWEIMEPSIRERLDQTAIAPAIHDLLIAPSALRERGPLFGGIALILRDPRRFPLTASEPAAR